MEIKNVDKLLADLTKFEQKAQDVHDCLSVIQCFDEELQIQPVPADTLAVFDLETTDLNGEFGQLVCGSILSLPSGKMTTWRQDQFVRSKKYKTTTMLDDKELACVLRDELGKHAAVCGWYSKGFDWPFLNTRLFLHEEEQLEPKLHIDGIWYAKGWRGIKLRNGKLATMGKALPLGELKLEVPTETWMLARHGDKAANDFVQERCEGDVRLTFETTQRFFKAGFIKKIESYG